ncbi:hypothetical protein [Streptomyces lavendulae]|uniref:hypothetical protein n=1 Tax=Streptomyces lavendulae TaxID=1914 RepID=UPI0036B1186E
MSSSDGIGAFTESERLDRLRGLLSGGREEECAGRAGGPDSYGHLLTGVMLHGADRWRQGQEPTALEKLLLDAVGSVLSEEETKAWGGVYREVSSESRMALLPRAFVDRPVESGYGLEDLRRDLPEIVAEAMAAGNTQIIDPRTPARETNDPAFLAAMRAAKLGITAFAPTGERLLPDAASSAASEEGAPEAPEDPERADGQEGAEGREGRSGPPYRVRILAESFYVHKAVGDQWGGRDEIFWTAAGSTGGGSKHSFTSEEFGAVEDGDTRVFTQNNKTLFDGSSSGDYLGLNITCWEKDQAPDEWWKALNKALLDAMEALNRNLAFDDFVTGQLPVWLGIALQVANMFIDVMMELINMSDISCQRVIGMGRYELAVLSRGGASTWKFDGDGHHDLRVQWAGSAAIPFHEDYLKHSVRTGSTLSEAAHVPFKTITSPALAVHEGRLYACYLRPSDQAVMWASMNTNGTWTAPAAIHGDQSWYAPTLTSAHGKLYYAVTGKDGKIYTRTYTPTSGWSTYHQMPGRKQYSPALATYENEAWLVAYGVDENLWHSRHNGSSWSAWRSDELDWTVSTHVALAPRGARLWRIATGKDQKIYTSINGGGTWVSEGVPSQNWRASHAPALAGNGQTMTLLLRGLDANCWSAEFNGNWAGAQKVAGITLQETPAAVYLGGKLQMLYRPSAP